MEAELNQSVETQDNYETHLDMPISKTADIVERILNENSGDYENINSRQELNDVIENFLKQKTHSGNPDDFHNFAVVLACKDEYSLACKVLECGLKYFPRNVDLLADFLQYKLEDNTAENKKQKCEEYFKTLMSIPQRLWTWRGFSFCINYLIETEKDNLQSDEEIDALIDKTVNIAKKYRETFPYSEDGYRLEAVIYKEFNMVQKQRETLEMVLNQPLPCPRCAIMLADIYFEEGNYEKTLKCVNYAISNSAKMQRSTSSGQWEGYLYYLAALCLLADSQQNNKDLSNEDILKIYNNFNIALPFLNGNSADHYREVMKNKLILLDGKYHVEIPAEEENLFKFYDDIKNSIVN